MNLRWTLWFVFLIGWTAALVAPLPSSGEWPEVWFRLNLRFLVSKGLHVAAYAVLTMLTAWLAAPVRWRWLLMYLLMAHAVATELLQGLTPGRTGSLRDVAFDHVGIGLGVLLTLRVWTAADEPKQTTS